MKVRAKTVVGLMVGTLCLFSAACRGKKNDAESIEQQANKLNVEAADMKKAASSKTSLEKASDDSAKGMEKVSDDYEKKIGKISDDMERAANSGDPTAAAKAGLKAGVEVNQAAIDMNRQMLEEQRKQMAVIPGGGMVMDKLQKDQKKALDDMEKANADMAKALGQ
jgi:hypothetical protein